MIVPNFLKQIFSDHVSKKWSLLCLTHPSLKRRVEIEKLIKRNKIQFVKFDENFILDITKKINI